MIRRKPAPDLIRDGNRRPACAIGRPIRPEPEMPIPQRSFYFLRHGQTDWNAERRFQGHTDVALNELGLSQAQRAAQALAGCPVDIIVASPLIRALKTAAIVAERLNEPLFVDSALEERHFGAFEEGLVIDDVKRRLGLKPHERLVQHLPADAEQWHETGARAAGGSAPCSTATRTAGCCS